MNTKLANITAQYRKFNDNQALTENQLNELIDYFEDQDRLSRTRLSGTGIVCGFNIKQAIKTKEITISQGAGVTTDGDLITLQKKIAGNKEYAIELENKTYTHFRIYKDPSFYPNFKNGSTRGGVMDAVEQISLYELRNEKDILESEKASFTPIIKSEFAARQMTVLLYLEGVVNAESGCEGIDCNNQGKEQVGTLRVLLTNPRYVDLIINGTTQDDIYNKHNSIENLYKNLPNIQVSRAILKPEITTEVTLINQFNTAIENDGIIGKLSNGFMLIAKEFNIELSLAGETLLNKLTNMLRVTGTKDFQYRYDLLKDLVATYNEIKALLLSLKAECCPDIKSFSKHLMLGTLDPIKGVGIDTHRHSFYKSPIITQDDENYARVMFLANRFAQQAYDFQSTKGAIKITPSQYNTDLGEKAIPFYYDVNTSLLKNWNFDKTQKEKEAYNLSYHTNSLAPEAFIQKPLEYNIDDNDFYRIEGHLGLPYEMAYKNIEALKNTYGLSFSIRTVFLKESAKLSNGVSPKPVTVEGLRKELLAITNGITNKEDINTVYRTISSLDRKLESFSKYPGWEPKDPIGPIDFDPKDPRDPKDDTGNGSDSSSGSTTVTPKEDKIESVLLKDFLELHSGMEHYAGVQPGGTFILIYESEENDQVLADFALPYVCCAKEEPVLLSLPSNKLCNNDAPVVMAIAPLDGEVKALVGGKEIPAIVKQGGQSLFDPSKVVFAANTRNSTVNFTVNEKPVDTIITVYKKTEVNVTVSKVVYTEGTATVDFKVDALNGGALSDIETFHWKFGNGKEIQKAPNLTTGIYTYSYILAAGQEEIFKPVLIVTNKKEKGGCSSEIIIEPVSLKLIINKDTKINIFFDASGSMSTTEAPLKDMRDTLLKRELLPLYGGDEVAYNKNVKVSRFTDERTFKALNMDGVTPSGNVINMVFQDEANSIYHSSSSITNRTATFVTDMAAFRSRIANNFGTGNPNYYRGIVFQVKANGNNLTFHNLMKAVQGGTGSYTGVYNLNTAPYNEKTEFVYAVTDGGTANYYMGLVKQALIGLGYSL